MSWTYTYDTATPAGSDDPAEADDRMREIKLAVQEVMDVEHDWALTGTSLTGDGKHTDITTDSIVNAGTLTNTGAITAVAAITVGTTLDVTGNIDPTTYETTNGGFLDEDDMASDAADKVASQQSIKAYADAAPAAQMTPTAESGAAGSTGETVFANGLRIAYGSESVAAGAEDTITLSGWSAVYSAVATINEDLATDRTSPKVCTISTGSFHIRNTSSVTLTYQWIAIGR